jgi:lanosterol synthase
MAQTRKAALNAVNGSVVNGTAKSSARFPEKKLNGYAHHVELLDQKTDYSRWRLLDEQGRHTWHYLTTEEQVKAWPQTTADKYHLGLPTVCYPILQ